MTPSDEPCICLLRGNPEYDFSRNVCKNCGKTAFTSPIVRELARSDVRKKRDKGSLKEFVRVLKINYCWVLIVVVSIVASGIFRSFGTWSSTSEISDKIAELKRHFPSQVKESWIRIQTALELNGDTTKSLLLLHGDDKSTCDCLKKKLASIHRERRKGPVNEYLTFEGSPETGVDYGLVLQHYRPLIKEHGVFIIDLNNVSGNIARIFHPLCDETYPDGNPALLIFTLRDLKGQKSGRTPLNRAEAILKAAWRNLPENEINPLISRIVKNVVAVLSEKEKPPICTSE